MYKIGQRVLVQDGWHVFVATAVGRNNVGQCETLDSLNRRRWYWEDIKHGHRLTGWGEGVVREAHPEENGSAVLSHKRFRLVHDVTAHCLKTMPLPLALPD